MNDDLRETPVAPDPLARGTAVEPFFRGVHPFTGNPLFYFLTQSAAVTWAECHGGGLLKQSSPARGSDEGVWRIEQQGVREAA